MFQLKGRKVLITGSSGGIGAAIAHLFYSLGANVCLHGTNESKLKELCSSLGARAHYLTADLMDRSSIQELAMKAEDLLGGVDILINNAGITKDGLFLRMKEQDWDDVVRVNLTAVFLLTKLLIPGMVKRHFGRIINISSVVGISGNPGQANYCATKAGIIGFSKSLAQEVAKRQITVNSIAPGFIESAMTGKLNESQKSLILEKIPQRKMGQGKDIAAAAAYLASDMASYVTGQTLHVNGGLLMP